jgi:acetoin utilization protein AcuB
MDMSQERRKQMLVGERMTKDPIVIRDDTPIDEAMKIMRNNKVRRLPVLNSKGALVGIVSEKDLLYASPSPATSLSIYELHYLMSKITVADVMITEVITVTEDTPLEEAARIMADNKIGGLPVMSNGELVGIITETDLFKIFLELLGAREMGVRLAMLVPDEKGVLAKISGKIAELGGNIVSLGTFLGEDPTNALLTIKVQDVEKKDLVKAMEPLAMEMVDVRMCEEWR